MSRRVIMIIIAIIVAILIIVGITLALVFTVGKSGSSRSGGCPDKCNQPYTYCPSGGNSCIPKPCKRYTNDCGNPNYSFWDCIDNKCISQECDENTAKNCPGNSVCNNGYCRNDCYPGTSAGSDKFCR